MEIMVTLFLLYRSASSKSLTELVNRETVLLSSTKRTRFSRVVLLSTKA